MQEQKRRNADEEYEIIKDFVIEQNVIKCIPLTVIYKQLLKSGDITMSYSSLYSRVKLTIPKKMIKPRFDHNMDWILECVRSNKRITYIHKEFCLREKVTCSKSTLYKYISQTLGTTRNNNYTKKVFDYRNSNNCHPG